MASSYLQVDPALVSKNNPCYREGDLDATRACLEALIPDAPRYTGSDAACDPGMLATTFNYWTGANPCDPIPNGLGTLLLFGLGIGLFILVTDRL